MPQMTWANIFGSFLFGTIGFSVFLYGKKQAEAKPLIVGILLMAFPYFITNTVWIYAVGSLLILSLFLG